ncbi:MAG TPA: ribosome small subunit-dependent GTPase A [Mycobacteriales bacterium]|nr:ribosome small subunit-dependent GTPase A [Mycobacteriales bacterium]
MRGFGGAITAAATGLGSRALSRRQVDDEDLLGRQGRGSRPRSRLRPRHDDAVSARVVSVDRGRYGVLLDSDETLVVAMRARELGRRAVVVGDAVDIVGDRSGGPDALARIVRIAERRSVLRRSADDADPVERVLVANADQMVVVCAAANPEPQPRLVDRCLVAAYDAEIDPVLCITKSDVAAPDALVATYTLVGVPIVVSGRPGFAAAVEELRARLHERVTVLVGSSGVGKSTLVNALVPDATQRIGEVSERTGKGQHTTTAAVALPLPGGGWVIDTPGIRSFGLAHVSRARLVSCFPDLVGGTEFCPTDCDHLDPEVCELDAWVESGHAAPERLDSMRRLLVTRDAT